MSGNELNVSVKALEWEYHERPMLTYVASDERGMMYHVNQAFGSDSYYFATVRFDGALLYDGDDLPSAQAAAQSDYEQRILSALSPQPVTKPAMGGGWMPIETAPRDGTDILVCDSKVCGGHINVVSYTEEDYPNVWETQEFLAYHKDAFTHWHPLPAAPTTGGEEL
jgi:hypothetical protein